VRDLSAAEQCAVPARLNQLITRNVLILLPWWRRSVLAPRSGRGVIAVAWAGGQSPHVGTGRRTGCRVERCPPGRCTGAVGLPATRPGQ
jgi:hypothetical protein